MTRKRTLRRRRFLAAAALPPFLPVEGRAGRAHTEPAAVPAAGNDEGSLTDVPGLSVGHFTDARRPTGCTAILVEKGAVGAVDVRGGAPGTRELELLDPVNTVGVVHAILLSGGSAFGLDAAGGVVRWLEEHGIGLPVGAARVPIVPAAILFDLNLGDARIRPDAAAGYAAARAAAGGPVAEGSVGAGAGATVGKMWGPARAMKGGVGTASVRLPGGLVVAALVAVNAFGDVLAEDGRVLAGARAASGPGLEPAVPAILAGRLPAGSLPAQNTTIGVVATNAPFSKAEAARVARMAHDGLARAITPAHTPWDGDTLFVLATGGGPPATPLVVGTAAAEVVARAIRRGARLARGVPGVPGLADARP